ncbi:YybH family protein [Flagellimonas meridianipacifica]|uniref:Ketosteroid isomerase-like protein n=1 Tax=Flagellimonas meridianipacifica TaxID=1080225 RepID=A0A2T0MD00_9FLAO|nr:nuclear transport factor 2 family protein [Allomuricauda pacifica]PRX55367.1 ketosteroid isomerase-like protein [Allomuricauda pacifica]
MSTVINYNKRVLFILLINATIMTSFGQNKEQMDDRKVLSQLVEDYKLWSVQEKPYRIEKIEHLYSHTEELLAFDLMSPERTVIRGWESYKAIWVPAMRNFDTWTITGLSDVEITVDKSMALTTLLFTGEGELKDGTPVKGEFHSTLVWKKSGEGWKIVHEHVSGPVKR